LQGSSSQERKQLHRHLVAFFQSLITLRVSRFNLLFQLFSLLLQLRRLFGLQACGCGGFTEASGAQGEGG
jgi:hypothetical protein